MGDVSLLLEPELSDEEKLLSKCTSNCIVDFGQIYSEEVMEASKKVIIKNNFTIFKVKGGLLYHLGKKLESLLQDSHIV